MKVPLGSGATVVPPALIATLYSVESAPDAPDTWRKARKLLVSSSAGWSPATATVPTMDWVMYERRSTDRKSVV